MKPIVAGVCLVAGAVAFASPANADLRYRTRIEVRTTPTDVKAPIPVVETSMLIHGDAVRLEQVSGGSKSVLLLRPGGAFVLDLEARTYRRIPDMRAVLKAATPGAPRVRRTGDFTTMLGLRTERVEVDMSMPMPITPPPGVPTTLRVTGELWLADAHRAYAANINRAMGMSAAASPELEGIVMRQIVRNAQFGIEIEHLVIELVEAPVAQELFEVPADFRNLSDPAARP
jgi:hypothetical protein